MPVVLIVDDDPQIRETFKILLADDYEPVAAGDGPEALEVIGSRHVDIVLLDLKLPGMDGIKVLEQIKKTDPELGVFMVSATDSAGKAVNALKIGAYDYIVKPFDNNEFLSKLKRYTETIELRHEVAYLKEELKEHAYCEIIGRSPRMRKVFDLIEKVSKTSSSVLVTGDSGTGKELVARAICSMGPRKEKPFVAVNCGAVPGELMESELFGYEKGAFTGAHARKLGKFEYADGGTIFLDEISTLPMHLQIKLLRFLQERAFERVGGNISIKVDVRIIAATNIDLEEAVRKGAFREDLYYRLKVFPIGLPPLRERREDIGLLARHFLAKHGRRINKTIRGITPDALRALSRYPWPGNVRELENLIERLVVLAREGGRISVEDLPVEMLYNERVLQRPERINDFREAVKTFERRYIISVLEKTNWNRIDAARVLRIHRNTLLMKMKTLDIKPPERPFGLNA